MSYFEQLGLEQSLLTALTAAGYEAATPIQAQAIPLILDGCDLIATAQTGTGKTAAFALPTLQLLMEQAPTQKSAGSQKRQRRQARCLVIAPTRELAVQIAHSFSAYGRHSGLKVAVVHGGVGQSPQVRAIENGVDILVATPGRLLDLMQQRIVDLSSIEMLILDEADQMFDMGFLPDLRRIVAQVPEDRQTLLFSATMPDAIRAQAKRWMYEPEMLSVARVSSPTEQVSQSVFHVDLRHKPAILTGYLSQQQGARTLVFTRTKHGADKVVKILSRAGIAAVAIHGNKSHNTRKRHLERFCASEPPVLVATDVAARGLDVNGVSHVINYDVPSVAEIYVHRIGRAGRAGATGVATSFCSPDERAYLQGIEKLIRRQISVDLVTSSWVSGGEASVDNTRRASHSSPNARRKSTSTSRRFSSPQVSRQANTTPSTPKQATTSAAPSRSLSGSARRIKRSWGDLSLG